MKLPADGPRDFLWRFGGGKAANPVLLDLDDLPEIVETEPNDQPAQANTASVPCVLNGRIDRPGDVDFWSFQGKKGESIALELRRSSSARRCRAC